MKDRIIKECLFMKKFTRSMSLFLAFLMLAVCFASIASASSYTVSPSTASSYDTGQKYFDAVPGNRIRFITTPSSSQSAARYTINLYQCYNWGAQLVNATQTHGVGYQSIPWWMSTNPGNYSIQLSISNNYMPSGAQATVNFSSSRWENYWG